MHVPSIVDFKLGGPAHTKYLVLSLTVGDKPAFPKGAVAADRTQQYPSMSHNTDYGVH